MATVTAPATQVTFNRIAEALSGVIAQFETNINDTLAEIETNTEVTTADLLQAQFAVAEFQTAVQTATGITSAMSSAFQNITQKIQ